MPNRITGFLKREAGRREDLVKGMRWWNKVRVILCEKDSSCLLALQREERAMSQGVQSASEVQTSKEIDLSRESPEGNVA